MKKNNHSLFIFVLIAGIIVTSQHFYHYMYARSLIATSLYKVACLPAELIYNKEKNDQQLLLEAHISHKNFEIKE